MESQASTHDPNLIVLDPRRMMTTGQYASAKGYSAGRVSQMKSEGKLNIFPVPQFGLELIIIEENELELMRAVPRIDEPLYSFNYRQLGGYFANLLHQYETDLTEAERISREQQQARQATLLAHEKLAGQYEQLEAEQRTLQQEQVQQQEAYTALQAEHATLQQQAQQHEQEAVGWQQERTRLQEALTSANQSDIREELQALKAEVERLRKATEQMKPATIKEKRSPDKE